MRFFRYSLTFFIIIVVLFCLGFFVLQELVLSQAVYQLTDSIATLRNTKTQRSSYQYCEALGTQQYDDFDMFIVQLRFISDKDYLVEIVCNQYEFKPKLIAQYSLPQFARKLPGPSGIIYDPEASWRFEIQAVPDQLSSLVGVLPALDKVLLRTKTLTITGNTPALSQTVELSDPGPKTVCSGYGYACCDQVQFIGIGNQRPGTDCPETCYEQCQPRPIILSFSGEPGFDRYQRVLTIPIGGQTTFTFVTDAVLPDQSQVRIDFGDGNDWTGTAQDTSVLHQYDCPGGGCSYRATIEVTDAYGNQSAATPISQMQVVIAD